MNYHYTSTKSEYFVVTLSIVRLYTSKTQIEQPSQRRHTIIRIYATVRWLLMSLLANYKRPKHGKLSKHLFLLSTVEESFEFTCKRNSIVRWWSHLNCSTRKPNEFSRFNNFLLALARTSVFNCSSNYKLKLLVCLPIYLLGNLAVLLDFGSEVLRYFISPFFSPIKISLSMFWGCNDALSMQLI